MAEYHNITKRLIRRDWHLSTVATLFFVMPVECEYNLLVNVAIAALDQTCSYLNALINVSAVSGFSRIIENCFIIPFFSHCFRSAVIPMIEVVFEAIRNKRCNSQLSISGNCRSITKII